MSKKKVKTLKFDDYSEFTIGIGKTTDDNYILEIIDYGHNSSKLTYIANTKKELVDKFSKFIGK